MSAAGSCQAPNCDVELDAGHIFCRAHWTALPRKFQQHLWKYAKDPRVPEPSKEWNFAVEKALGFFRAQAAAGESSQTNGNGLFSNPPYPAT